MRAFSLTAAMILGLFCATAQAEPDTAATDEAFDLDDAAELSAPSDALRAAGYNIWFCSAVRRGPFGAQGPLYFGASNPFFQGSGQGQAAKAGALRQAVQACGSSCLTGCFVKSFQL